MQALERVHALRLVRPKAAEGRDPIPPLGLRAFDDTAADVAIFLDVDPSASERAQVEAAAAQIPHARDLPPGRIVVVLPERATPAGIFARLFGGARATVPRAVRATALLARGYKGIASTVDAKTDLDLVWAVA
jgi:hypothetical protein